jgi:RyR and IP3R Homology associated
MFGAWIKFANIHSLRIGSQMLEFLIESVQGPCRDNQITLTKSKSVDFIKDLFKGYSSESSEINTELINKGFKTEAQREELTNLIKQGITLMNSLIEANKDRDKEIIDYISDNVDYNDLKATMLSDYTWYVTKTLKLSKRDSVTKIEQRAKKHGYDPYIMSAFNIYILIKFLSEKNEYAKYNFFSEEKFQKGEDRKYFEKCIEFFLRTQEALKLISTEI